MLGAMLRFVELGEQALARGMSVADMAKLPIVRRLRRMGEDIGEPQLAAYDELRAELEHAFVEAAA
jgi:glutathione S-transferase